MKISGELNLDDIKYAVRYWLEETKGFDLEDEELFVRIRGGPVQGVWEPTDSQFDAVTIHFTTEEPKLCLDSEADHSTGST